MFLINISSDIVESWKSRLKYDSCHIFYNDLCNDRYDIYFSFDEKKQTLLYEAISKDSDNQDTISLYVSSNKQISTLPRKTSYFCAYADQILALYIHKKEKNKTDEQLQAIYGPLYEKLHPLSYLSAEDATKRQKLMPLYQELAQELTRSDENLTPVLSAKKLAIYYFIAQTDNGFAIKIKAGFDNKVRYAKNAYDFVTAGRVGGDVTFAKDILTITPDMIPESEKATVDILASQGKPRKVASRRREMVETGEIYLGKNAACSFFYSLANKHIELNESGWFISPKIVVPKAEVLDDGSFRFDPTPKGTILLDGMKGVLIPKDGNTISLIQFDNSKERTMFKFLYDHPDFRFDLFQTEVSNELIPAFDDRLSVSKEFQKRNPTRKEEIHFYITYTDKETLSFKTEYINGDEKVKEEEFVSHPLGENKCKQFKASLEHYQLPMHGEMTSQEDILRFLKTDLTPLFKSCKVFLSDNLVGKKVSGVGKVSVKTKSGIDWLNMEISSDRYTEEELDEILTAYRKKRKYIRLKDAFISFEEEDSEAFTSLVDDFSLSKVERKKMPLYQVLKLPNYDEKNVHVDLSKDLVALFEDIKNFKNHPLSLPSTIKATLRPYQEDGVRWLHVLKSHHLSGILADDMGLGKTLQMICLLSLEPHDKPVLIVSPKSLIYNWEHEFKMWNPSQKVYVLDGSKNKRNELLSSIGKSNGDVYVVSYETLRNDLELFDQYSFSFIILDEGQNIANVYAKKTKAVKEIKADYKFVLTGTPIQNSLVDLWSIFDFLMPGYLPDYKDFTRDYGRVVIDDPKMKEHLMKKINPFLLKRVKKDVLSDLPDKEERIMTIGMTEEQRELYDAYIQKARHSLMDEEKSKIEILAEITRLRQLCVDPSMFIENFKGLSEKLDATIETIKTAILSGHKLLVFSTFAKTLFHLKDLLQEEGIASYMIYGDTKAKDRTDMADNFNNKDDIKVMLVSLKAGGTGLNLVGADIVIHLDPWWNLAAENQASDRAHRIGQTRKVTIMKMVCKDSIEERVIQLQEMKKELTSVISKGEDSITSINTEDLQFLLS